MNCRQQKWNFGDSVHFLLCVWPAGLAPVSNPKVSAEQFRFPGFFQSPPPAPQDSAVAARHFSISPALHKWGSDRSPGTQKALVSFINAKSKIKMCQLQDPQKQRKELILFITFSPLLGQVGAPKTLVGWMDGNRYAGCSLSGWGGGSLHWWRNPEEKLQGSWSPGNAVLS